MWPNFVWFYQKVAENGPQKIFKRSSSFLAVITTYNVYQDEIKFDFNRHCSWTRHCEIDVFGNWPNFFLNWPNFLGPGNTDDNGLQVSLLFQSVLDKGGKVLVHCVQVLNSTIHIQIFLKIHRTPCKWGEYRDYFQLTFRAKLYLIFTLKLCSFWLSNPWIQTLIRIDLKSCARIFRPSFRENKPKTFVFSHRKQAFWACFRKKNWVYKFGHWTRIALEPMRIHSTRRDTGLSFYFINFITPPNCKKTAKGVAQARETLRWF